MRELENTIERIYVMVENDKSVTPDILVKHGLGLDFIHSDAHAPAVTVHRLTTLKEALAETEEQLLSMAMERHKGIKEISQVLGVDQSTISRKLKRLRERRKIE